MPFSIESVDRAVASISNFKVPRTEEDPEISVRQEDLKRCLINFKVSQAEEERRLETTSKRLESEIAASKEFVDQLDQRIALKEEDLEHINRLLRDAEQAGAQQDSALLKKTYDEIGTEFGDDTEN
ncbi:unnamed protein product, partial [Mesorhabditis spiculigera]